MCAKSLRTRPAPADHGACVRTEKALTPDATKAICFTAAIGSVPTPAASLECACDHFTVNKCFDSHLKCFETANNVNKTRKQITSKSVPQFALMLFD